MQRSFLVLFLAIVLTTGIIFQEEAFAKDPAPPKTTPCDIAGGPEPDVNIVEKDTTGDGHRNQVFVDKNGNGTRDPGEPGTDSAQKGTVKIQCDKAFGFSISAIDKNGFLIEIFYQGDTSQPFEQDNLGSSRLLEWDSKRPLTWDDFQGNPDESSEHDAETESTLRSQWNGIVVEGGIKVTEVKATAFFSPDESWVKDGKKTKELLNHEQGHFDIAQIFALKKQLAMNTLIGQIFPNEAAVKAAIIAVCDNIDAEWNAFDDLYDDETDHSKDADKQKEWDKKIKKMLKDLKKMVKDASKGR